MSKLKLTLISLLIIVALAGTAHLFANLNKTVHKVNKKEQLTELEGRWKVYYESEEFTGFVINEIRSESGSLKAYTVGYNDMKASAADSENPILIFDSFDGRNGTGTYITVYEGKTYELACKIHLKNASTLKVSYDYYGEGAVEIWNKLNK